jgi:hypothetical protein
MAINYYRSDDTGAPGLDGQAGSLIALLKACLVDGYDVKPGAGWTVALEDAVNDKIIFRNSAVNGTGRYFRFQDNGHHDATAGTGGTKQQLAYYHGCESYTDIDTTLGNFPAIANQGDANSDSTTYNGVTIQKAETSGDAGLRDWIIVADDSTCILLTFHRSGATFQLSGLTNTATATALYYFGDVETLMSAGDPYACVVTGDGYNTSDSISWIRWPDLDNSNVGYRYKNRGYQGNAGGIKIYGWSNIPYSPNAGGAVATATDAQMDTSNTTASYPDPVCGGVRASEIFIYEEVGSAPNTDAVTSDSWTLQAKYKGVLAIYHALNDGVDTTNGIGNPLDTFTYNGNDYLLLPIGNNSSPYTQAVQISGDFV